jgi:hypothetical protein
VVVGCISLSGCKGLYQHAHGGAPCGCLVRGAARSANYLSFARYGGRSVRPCLEMLSSWPCNRLQPGRAGGGKAARALCV